MRRMTSGAAVVLLWASLGLTAAGDVDAPRIRDLNSRMLAPFAPAGTANVLFFLQTDCPVSNSYAPEIQRVCRDYADRGVGCALFYEDVEIGVPSGRLEEAARRHHHEYQYSGIPAAVDRKRAIATHVKATVTPQAVVVNRSGVVKYSGRIDNFYAALGRPRQRVTEHDLRNALDALVAGKPVPRPHTDAIGCHIVDPAILEHR